jgi:hypothetical protein
MMVIEIVTICLVSLEYYAHALMVRVVRLVGK